MRLRSPRPSPDDLHTSSALPASRSQAGRWRDIIEERLAKRLNEEVLPHIQSCLQGDKLAAQLHIDKDRSIYLDYDTQVGGYGYTEPHIKIEFGARSTGEPTVDASLSCDAAEYLSDVIFPNTNVRVMRIERTAWEEMTAIHVFCLRGNIQDRRARHWSDIVRLDAAVTSNRQSTVGTSHSVSPITSRGSSSRRML